MKIWIDLTNSPHPLLMKPVMAELQGEGHDISVTARGFSETLAVCRRLGIPHTAIGHHYGARRILRSFNVTARTGALVRWAKGRNFDLAFSHGSSDQAAAAKMLRIPCATMFDNEWRKAQHRFNCALVNKVIVPEAITQDRLDRFQVEGKLERYPGIKEEYYLAEFEPDPTVFSDLQIDRSLPIAVVRIQPTGSLLELPTTDLVSQALQKLRGYQTIVLPRSEGQRQQLRAARGFAVPKGVIDAPSLIAYSDLVVASGVMCREAAALGVPAYTLADDPLPAVDEQLVAQKRLHRLESADQLQLTKRPSTPVPRVRRDPALLARLFLKAFPPEDRLNNSGD